MKLGVVSTYPPLQCGIGTYAQQLIGALLASPEITGIHLATRTGYVASAADQRMRVVHCFDGGSDYVDAIFHEMKDAAVDVVHVQHAPDSLGLDDRLPRLVQRLDAAGIPAVVTLHTVYGSRISSALGLSADAPRFHRKLGACAQMVVHHETIRAALIRQGAARDRVTTIPHGTPLMTPGDRAAARRDLGLPREGIVFLFFGFVHAQKNLHSALWGFLLAARDLPGAVMVVAGSPRAQLWYNNIYYQALRRMADLLPGGERVIWHNRFVQSADMVRYFSAADIVLLPHAFQGYGSASGILHLSIGSGLPIIVSREPKFSELGSVEGFPEACSVRAVDIFAWARAMRRLASDGTLRRLAADAVGGYARETSWTAVAGQHRDLYRCLLARRAR